jgi:hypothetical protein
MKLLADNILHRNQKLYAQAVPRYYKLFGYEVIIVKSDMVLDYDGNYIPDKFKKGYGSVHSSTHTATAKKKEIKEKIIVPNIRKLTNLYNDTDNELIIYHTNKDLLIIGDILKINYNNKLYEYKVSEHPLNYYDVLYEFKLQSMYMGSLD